jgi:hypothetical protein
MALISRGISGSPHFNAKSRIGVGAGFVPAGLDVRVVVRVAGVVGDAGALAAHRCGVGFAGIEDEAGFGGDDHTDGAVGVAVAFFPGDGVVRGPGLDSDDGRDVTMFRCGFANSMTG